ncbi:nitrite/sulfite reductase [Alloacidobacterium sp.]|uniref:nitrite/sulfite reductase n=1 Tax=Alloacidobacterium sp. TaxID=2951999 RepID=UPI002D372B5F|nr:nitrite/sulfite reductase [Alloacidobacterium sp.]HYK37077.1 nitrite/sulfite reductase [Alloacidobacterium sp.]
MTDIAPPKETKAQRMERLKREKNPWEAFNEVREFARQGRASVVPEWASAYFKWWGVYTQGDGIGAVGGKGGEGLASEYFMMRVGIPNGIIRADQLRVIANIAKKHARNLADITVRQNIQLHWLTIESLPEIVDALNAVGLSPKGACGDVVRNVTGCPLAGIDHEEILDASPLALEIAHKLIANPEFYNLPRKFKISVSGCSVWCNYPELNDVALTAVRRGGEVGYSLRVGGGLSNQPHLAVKLNAFIKPEQAFDAVRGVAEIFRDEQVLRESRDRARLKYLFTREGWTAEKFLHELESRLGYKLDPGVAEDEPEDILRDHVGIHKQKQQGLSFVGASVLRGRLTGDQLASAAELAERYGSGNLRATVMQNLIFIDVPTAKAIDLAGEIEKIGMRVEGSTFWRGAIACTGTEFCKLAITETKGFTRWLVEELEELVPQFDEQLKLNVTGCPNGCGQHWIADIGLEGKKVKQDAKMVDAYYFCVGGAVGKYAGIARQVGYRVAATEAPAAIARLLRSYLSERKPAENLRAYFGRHTEEEIRNRLSGVAVEAVARDLPVGPVPVGVAG